MKVMLEYKNGGKAVLEIEKFKDIDVIKKENKSEQIKLFVLKIDGKKVGKSTSDLRLEIYKIGYLEALRNFNIMEDYIEEEITEKEGNCTYYIANVTLIKNKEG